MVKIYSIHYIKPEFISLQYLYLKKHCVDDYELIVINNGINDDVKEEINVLCVTLGVSCIIVEKRNDVEEYCSQSHCVAIEYALQSYIKTDSKDNLTVIMDSDVFPFKTFSFYEILNGKKIGGIYQQRNEHEYLSAIFTLFLNSIDLSNFSFYNGIGDTGSGTDILIEENPTEFVKHTAKIDSETTYIFNGNNNEFQYKPYFGCQFIANIFIHYYRGSNWSENDPEYHKEKYGFLMNFLSNPDSYKINLDDYVSYDKAHSEKSYNGIDNNYSGYRFLNTRK